VALAALLGNRIVAVLAGLWFHMHPLLLLSQLLLLDVIQIPLYYWLYENGAQVMEHLQRWFQNWLNKDKSVTLMGPKARSWGGLGVMLVAALPTFGGGMWSAIFLAYGLGLRKRYSYLWLTAGSFLSYLVIYWIGDTLVVTARYFSGH
jgi:uncharacterized membrane protein